MSMIYRENYLDQILGSLFSGEVYRCCQSEEQNNRSEPKMIPVEVYVEYIKNGIVPPGPPEMTDNYLYHPSHDYYDPLIGARSECTSRGMWTIVDTNWTRILADWIGDRKCLEIMAGAGWLSYALSVFGAKCTATDDFSWEEKHDKMILVFPVKRMDAVESVQYFTNAEILLISWPPNKDDTICRACENWGQERPIVYIGEDAEGCNAPEEFWEHFTELKDGPEIPMRSWDGVRDSVYIGYWEK